MDVLWQIPLTKWMRVYEAEAQEMVRARVKVQDFPHFRDLASYWVSHSSSSASVMTDNEFFPKIEGGLSLKDMDTDAVVVILGGTYDSSSRCTI